MYRRMSSPGASALLLAGTLLFCRLALLASAHPAHPSTLPVTIATANLSDNFSQAYQDPGIRILQALRPDIVGIQEFNYRLGSPEELVLRIFGPDYHFHRESGARLPNGIISRFPILEAGQWEDPFVQNRNFAWVTLDIPGPKRLHVVSVHLVQNKTARRTPQARLLMDYILQAFPPDDYVVLCGDLNISTRVAEALSVLTSWFDDSRHPADQLGNKNTNAERSRPYDVVLPNPALARHHAPTRLARQSFPDGLVFDTRLWDPPPTPAEWEDSARNLQHLPVMKTFHLPLASPPASPP